MTEPGALAACSDAERATVLAAFGRRRPSAAPAGRAGRARLLSAIDRAAVAATVSETLLTIRQAELAHRAGRTRYGYVEPSEAAWQLLDEAFQPWVEDAGVAPVLDSSTPRASWRQRSWTR